MLSVPDILDYEFMANDKNHINYAKYSAAVASTAMSARHGHEISNRLLDTISGTAALTAAASVTATTAIFASSNSSSFAASSLITAASSSLSSPTSSPLLTSSDSNMFSNVAVDLGSLLINETYLNDTSLLADLVNISEIFNNVTESVNTTSSEDVGELIRMAATSVVLGLMILITIIGEYYLHLEEIQR